MVEIRGQRSPGCALEGSAVGRSSGSTSWLFSRGRDFGPGAYLFVVLGTSTRLRTSSDFRSESNRGGAQAGKPKCAFDKCCCVRLNFVVVVQYTNILRLVLETRPRVTLKLVCFQIRA